MTKNHVTTVAAAAPALLADVLRRVGQIHMRATGGSMLPAIGPGDVLLVRACALDVVEPGDVVLFTNDGRVFAHRLIEKDLDRGFFVTRGDSNWRNDPPADASELLGQVIAVRRRGQVFGVPADCTCFDRARGLAASEWIAVIRRARALVRLATEPA